MNVKRYLPSLLFACLLSLASQLHAATTYFDVQVINGMAGFPVSLNVTYYEGGSTHSYPGTVTITATTSLGQNVNLNPGVSDFFSGSVWNGFVAFKTAGHITVTCTGLGGVVGSGVVDIGPSAATNLLIQLPGQTYTPGFTPAVNPNSTYSAPVGIFSGTYYGLTAYVTDQYGNWINNYTDSIILHTFFWGDLPPLDTTDGRVFPNVIFNATPGWYTITAHNLGTTINAFATGVYVNSNNSAYMQVKAPDQVVAGKVFGLTITARSGTDPGSPINFGADACRFNINRYLPVVNTADQITWNGSFNWGGPISFGTTGGFFYLNGFTSHKAESIYIKAEQAPDTTGFTTQSIASNTMQILPDVPASIHVNVSPSQIQAQHSTRLSVVVYDQYNNPCVIYSPNYYVVTFTENQGQGYLGTVSGTRTLPTTTDSTGSTYCDFTGGTVNENALVEISVANTITAQTFVTSVSTIQVSVAKVEKGAITNYPNPFNPARNQKTAINYYLESSSDVDIRIYDPFGRLVLIKSFNRGDASDEAVRATSLGGAIWAWDGKNNAGRTVANGIYLVKVKARGDTAQDFQRRVGVLK
jgi:hypothetical protein